VICVAYDNLERFFPKDKIRLTGNPVRQEIAHALVTKQEGAKAFDFDPEKPIVLSVGGSLGARTINQSLEAKLNELMAAGAQLIWQTGKIYYEQYKHLQEEYPNQLRILPFIKDMPTAYGAADVIISRAGAIAVSELCLVGKPVILVPSPNVAEDHQRKNAEALVAKGAAKMVLDAQAKHELVPTVLALLDDKSAQQQLSASIKHEAKPNAVTDIVQEIVHLIQSRRS